MSTLGPSTVRSDWWVATTYPRVSLAWITLSQQGAMPAVRFSGTRSTSTFDTTHGA